MVLCSNTQNSSFELSFGTKLVHEAGFPPGDFFRRDMLQSPSNISIVYLSDLIGLRLF